jgi:cobalamin synthase
VEGNKLRAMIDGFFIVNPHRRYFIYVDSEAGAGAETFVVVTRGLDVVAFDRVPDENAVQAAALADWFSDTDEGQETVAKMIAGMDEEMRVGSEVQSRGDLALRPADPTVH